MVWKRVLSRCFDPNRLRSGPAPRDPRQVSLEAPREAQSAARWGQTVLLEVLRTQPAAVLRQEPGARGLE